MESLTVPHLPPACPPALSSALVPGWSGALVERTSLRELVHHSGSVGHDAPLEFVHRQFAEHEVEFLALVRDGMVTGLCSRLRLGILLGTRFGFSLYSRSPAHATQVERPLVFAESTPIREVLDRALARAGDEFREDVVLVDANHTLIGLIPIDALARLQTQLVSDQLAQLQRQHEQLMAADCARRQSQGRYLSLFENHTLGVALLDRTGAMHTHNRRLVELLNVPDASTMVPVFTVWLAEEERPVFLALLDGQAQGGPPTTCELRLNVPERGLRLFRCSMGWIAETAQVCACFDDITEQRAMERQLARQEKQTMLDTLVGGIAHELNNKLTPVQGFSELIATTADPQTRHYTEHITKSVAEAATIIRQLLQLSKPSTAMAHAVDLRGIVGEALSMLRFQIRDSRCKVTTREPAEPVAVRVDPAEIKQVIMNLVLNSLQAMADRAHAALDIEIVGERDRASVAVIDNGIGIPPENIERIFDPFFTTKGPERGTGLGLSVCFSIVRQHGGHISVESEPGAGARFTVTLPRESGVAGPEATVIGDVDRAELATDISEGARALVVEDEPHVRRLIREVLSSRYGCEVDTVANGVDALDRLATTRYALVISDVRMPAMNGTELYLWLREAQPLTAQRFVFVTGYPGESHLEAEVAEWGIPVLTKPFSVEALCRVCRPFLESATEAEPRIA